MHALAASYQPVAGEENEEQDRLVDGHKQTAASQFADYLPSVGPLRLGGEQKWYWRITSAAFGLPMPPHDPTRETAWLDGLRGVAAFLVMSYHFNVDWYEPSSVEEPWGSNLNDYGWDLWRMPFLRFFMCAGHTQVSIFFVLSGFVLSWSALGSIRAANYDKLYKGLGSSAFRRWIRLYLPTIPIAFWECIELYIGRRTIGGKEPKSNFFAQLWDFFESSDSYMNPLNFNRDQWNSLHPYDHTMWTIPYEFAGSMMVFFLLLAVGRIQNYMRRTIAIGIIVIYCAFRAEWSLWLFSNGILIADYVRERGGFKKISERQTTLSILGWSFLLVGAIWLGGLPAKWEDKYRRPGYDWLDSLTPENWDVEGGGRLWWNIAGITILFTSCHLSGVRWIFERSPMRYLGRVSYMLYLTHRVVLRPTLKPFRDWVINFYGRTDYIDTPRDNFNSSHWWISIACWLTLWAVSGPCAILVAHWSERLFDAPSVRFARWLDGKFMTGITKRVDPRAEEEPSLPTHSNGAAPYRDSEPLAPPSQFEENKEEREELELSDLSARPAESDEARPQATSLV